MFKKMFALASVTALTGLVASVAASGCSSTTEVSNGEAGTPLVEAGDAKKVPVDAPIEEPADTGPATCPTTDPIDATTAPWKPPASKPGSCTEKQISDLVVYVEANMKTSYADLKKTVTDATCAGCLFVKDGDKWGAFVEKADGTFLRNNFGGCVALASGKESCGKAYSQLDDCIEAACQDCADDPTTLQKCSSAAQKGACKAALTVYSTECGSDDAQNTCSDLTKKYTFEAAARALCIGLPNDGG